ncbi:uridine diphosphate-N-acetylglucosamine-binding protein YvcK [Actinomycetospora sp. TBRC 11914]|uniref:gluconeogenesis factor YvcK family protein n=1 Tax=Actinomycetospora sp. TBRC 11914 TaxID=2729387 RepID=UPI0017E612A0|nr:uridine diphosphate-N-acetylglucosamine-binding protein YvcK [Actinomycetospora sp. TBRC 11914]NMO89675.1 uridine diphosphate-N-acetylglucosamine-binding protein YvcK [Actinomycetospora sp. TBRC 11914]
MTGGDEAERSSAGRRGDEAERSSTGRRGDEAERSSTRRPSNGANGSAVPEDPGSPFRATALGGGHGLHATLRALRRLTDDVTAVVTVGDDGGSSGRIRRELDILPLGDLRMALDALAEREHPGPTDPSRWRKAFEHRFGGTGALAGHAVGNLVLAGLLDVLGDPVAALDEACRLLGLRGRVLPMSPVPVDIEADVTGLGISASAGGSGGDADGDVAHRIRGQVAVATTPGRVRQVRLVPRRPKACPEAVAAIRTADVVTLGPGSWFTSVMPHLLVPELFTALTETEARRVLVLNLAPQPGETAGFSPEQHLDALAEHAPRLRLDLVVADPEATPEPDRLRRGAEAFGAEILFTAVGEPGGAPRHDPVALAGALREAAGSAASRDRVPPDEWDARVDEWGSGARRRFGAGDVFFTPTGDARRYEEEDLRWP